MARHIQANFTCMLLHICVNADLPEYQCIDRKSEFSRAAVLLCWHIRARAGHEQRIAEMSMLMLRPTFKRNELLRRQLGIDSHLHTPSESNRRHFTKDRHVHACMAQHHWNLVRYLTVHSVQKLLSHGVCRVHGSKKFRAEQDLCGIDEHCMVFTSMNVTQASSLATSMSPRSSTLYAMQYRFGTQSVPHSIKFM